MKNWEITNFENKIKFLLMLDLGSWEPKSEGEKLEFAWMTAQFIKLHKAKVRCGKYKKINFEFRKNYITETHPEAESHTDDEIHALAKVVRNKVGIIVDPLHKTIPLLTKYEKTRILGIRTKQLNNGATPYVSSKTGLGSGSGQGQVIDGYTIALRELDEKKLPFIIRRPLPNGGTEYWYLQDLEVL